MTACMDANSLKGTLRYCPFFNCRQRLLCLHSELDLQLSIAGVTCNCVNYVSKYKCVHGSGLLWFFIPYVQRFTVTSFTLCSGASPLPAVWTLHGSRDGITFIPWRTFEAGDAPQGGEVSSRDIYLVCLDLPACLQPKFI